MENNIFFSNQATELAVNETLKSVPLKAIGSTKAVPSVVKTVEQRLNWNYMKQAFKNASMFSF